MTYTVMNGNDNVVKLKHVLQNKRVGIITNSTGINKKFERTVDILMKISTVTLLFAPEHGIRGNKQAGESVDSYFDDQYQLEVISLYGDKKAPNSNELEKVDVIVYDIQDVGSRYYTYIYTLFHTMKACVKAGVEVVVLDRVPLVDANIVIGNSVPTSQDSFIGMLGLPNSYGMTCGELANYFNQFYLDNKVKLSICKITGWTRSISFHQTDLIWHMPSPNIPSLLSAFLYQGTCLFEGTNVSEGRGTTRPFEIIGAPWINATKFAKDMNEKKLSGVYFIERYFKPYISKYEGQFCSGLEIIVTDKKACNPLRITIELLIYLQTEYPQTFKTDIIFPETKKFMLDHLAGQSLKYINTVDYFTDTKETKEFKQRRLQSLLYK